LTRCGTFSSPTMNVPALRCNAEAMRLDPIQGAEPRYAGQDCRLASRNPLQFITSTFCGQCCSNRPERILSWGLRELRQTTLIALSVDFDERRQTTLIALSVDFDKRRRFPQLDEMYCKTIKLFRGPKPPRTLLTSRDFCLASRATGSSRRRVRPCPRRTQSDRWPKKCDPSLRAKIGSQGRNTRLLAFASFSLERRLIAPRHGRS
jgi:hypothetical protein